MYQVILKNHNFGVGGGDQMGPNCYCYDEINRISCLFMFNVDLFQSRAGSFAQGLIL